jgi:hypothetical protein
MQIESCPGTFPAFNRHLADIADIKHCDIPPDNSSEVQPDWPIKYRLNFGEAIRSIRLVARNIKRFSIVVVINGLLL